MNSWFNGSRTGALVVLAAVGGFALGHTSARASYCDARYAGHILTNELPEEDDRYILVSPSGSHPMLLSRSGAIVHEWTTSNAPHTAYLQPDGRLYLMQYMGHPVYPGGGRTGRIEILDWDSKVLWQYDDAYMHHGFDILPDGGVAYIRWEEAPGSFAARVRGGRNTADDPSVWTDAIVVVDPQKKITWIWHMYEHLDPANYVVNDFARTVDWGHSNSVRYVKSNPLTGTPAFLLSVRHISRVFLIEAGTGSILWQSPEGEFSLQHDATLLANGDILVFDNSLFKEQPRANYWSRVVEIDPRTNDVVWVYEGGDKNAERAFFASSIMGAAQRLPNGNTLITSTTQGRIFEVTPENRIVWDYFNEYREKNGDPQTVFKARSYSPEGTAWGSWIRKAVSSLCP